MGNELSTLTADDLQVQLEQLQKTEAEDNARELLKQEISANYSYQRLLEEDFIGYMHAYVCDTVDFKTMTSRAKGDVILSLAKSDLLRDQTFFVRIHPYPKA